MVPIHSGRHRSCVARLATTRAPRLSGTHRPPVGGRRTPARQRVRAHARRRHHASAVAEDLATHRPNVPTRAGPTHEWPARASAKTPGQKACGAERGGQAWCRQTMEHRSRHEREAIVRPSSKLKTRPAGSRAAQRYRWPCHGHPMAIEKIRLEKKKKRTPGRAQRRRAGRRLSPTVVEHVREGGTCISALAGIALAPTVEERAAKYLRERRKENE